MKIIQMAVFILMKKDLELTVTLLLTAILTSTMIFILCNKGTEENTTTDMISSRQQG
jgi:hypothetical protein